MSVAAGIRFQLLIQLSKFIFGKFAAYQRGKRSARRGCLKELGQCFSSSLVLELVRPSVISRGTKEETKSVKPI